MVAGAFLCGLGSVTDITRRFMCARRLAFGSFRSGRSDLGQHIVKQAGLLLADGDGL